MMIMMTTMKRRKRRTMSRRGRRIRRRGGEQGGGVGGGAAPLTFSVLLLQQSRVLLNHVHQLPRVPCGSRLVHLGVGALPLPFIVFFAVWWQGNRYAFVTCENDSD